MPTTFEVIFLGNLALIDTTQGNEIAENASGLLGSFGTADNPLSKSIQTLSADRLSEDDNSTYDTDNGGGYDSFRINGGAPQNFDAISAYDATITYFDGTNATISAVVFQDVNGNTYLAPELSLNADQAALTAKPIQSLSLTLCSATQVIWVQTAFPNYLRALSMAQPETTTLLGDMSMGTGTLSRIQTTLFLLATAMISSIRQMVTMKSMVNLATIRSSVATKTTRCLVETARTQSSVGTGMTVSPAETETITFNLVPALIPCSAMRVWMSLRSLMTMTQTALMAEPDMTNLSLPHRLAIQG
ncbi:hypothetical protein [Marivita sp.]|uniref:hypothetical protein n=1 Tax=Marivita sp. TaxID=2003365 RepID=UPI00321BBD19